MSFMRVLYVPVYFTKYMGLVNVIIDFKIFLICPTCGSLSIMLRNSTGQNAVMTDTTPLSLSTFLLKYKIVKMNYIDIWINVCINSLKLVNFTCIQYPSKHRR